MTGLKIKLLALIDRAQDSLADMSPRDRATLLGLVGFACFVLVGGSIWWMRGSLSALEGRLEDRNEALRRVNLLAADHAEAGVAAAEIEASIQQHASTSLSTFLEQAAQRAKVGDKLEQVKERSTSVTGTLEEKLFSVRLSQLQQAELNAFLYHAETQGYPLQIKGMKIKTRKKEGDVLLDVEMDVSAYSVTSATVEPG
jgi:type II secretory pathway component PulM